VHVLQHAVCIVTGRGALATAAVAPDARAWFGDIVIVAFLCVQLLDGLLTYLGVAVFGVSEGNPLVAHAMHHAGIGPGLTGAKMVAAASAATLHLLGFHRLLATLTAVYLLFAILPWTFVLVLMH
jgi:hypothetical protein